MANEKRLIDANALIEALPIVTEDRKITLYGAVADFMIMISAMPTVDAVEVVHGRWLVSGMCDHKQARFRNPDKWTIYKCSECGYGNGRRKNANYCPNCGADMRGDGNG